MLMQMRCKQNMKNDTFFENCSFSWSIKNIVGKVLSFGLCIYFIDCSRFPLKERQMSFVFISPVKYRIAGSARLPVPIIRVWRQLSNAHGYSISIHGLSVSIVAYGFYLRFCVNVANAWLALLSTEFSST